jgi:hypothetical protein
MTTPKEKETKKEEKATPENIELKGSEIIKRLSEFSEELQEAISHDEKIHLLVNFDNFLKTNKEFIKRNCPDKLVSILRSI